MLTDVRMHQIFQNGNMDNTTLIFKWCHHWIATIITLVLPYLLHKPYSPKFASTCFALGGEHLLSFNFPKFALVAHRFGYPEETDQWWKQGEWVMAVIWRCQEKEWQTRGCLHLHKKDGFNTCSAFVGVGEKHGKLIKQKWWVW